MSEQGARLRRALTALAAVFGCLRTRQLSGSTLCSAGLLALTSHIQALTIVGTMQEAPVTCVAVAAHCDFAVALLVPPQSRVRLVVGMRYHWQAHVCLWQQVSTLVLRVTPSPRAFLEAVWACRYLVTDRDASVIA